MTMNRLCSALIFLAALESTLPVEAQGEQKSNRLLVPVLQAEQQSYWPASEARQGAAADGEHFYAIVNRAIGKYRREDGQKVGAWTGPEVGPVQHINSCLHKGERLWCANSNFPALPMTSSIEVFDAGNLKPVKSHSLGLTDGSLVWISPLEPGWLAGFAHYQHKGGVPDKNTEHTRILHLDRHWQFRQGWALPQSVIERLAPYSASGGALGPDGLLYITGHDRREMYVLALPEMGSYLELVATVNIDLPGQAFSWDPDPDKRIVWGISRPDSQVRSFHIPPVPPGDYRRFQTMSQQ